MKIHLIPRTSRFAICASRVRDGGRQAVTTRQEFNRLPKDDRCLRCDAILNGRSSSRIGRD